MFGLIRALLWVERQRAYLRFGGKRRHEILHRQSLLAQSVGDAAMIPFDLRSYQTAAVEYACDFFASAKSSDRCLIASPTGTGKSLIALAIQDQRGPGTWIITPRLEIVRGLLEKRGRAVPSNLSATALADLAWGHEITTPLRLRNAMLKGEGPDVARLIIDEAHHDSAETYQQLHALACVPAVGLTATPYRGTPRGTQAFREVWGEPVWAISLPEAVAEGHLSFPYARVVPLVDDEVIGVRGGEFVSAEVTKLSLGRLDAAVNLIVSYRGQPTIVSLPSTDLLEALQTLCETMGVATVAVTQATSPAAREEAFRACVSAEAALLQINVVSEGVDLPLRVLIDLAPTMSPVRWLQQVGRITRPGGVSHYVCTNRNILRHGYLMEGLLPRSVFRDSQEGFPLPATRATATRVIGLEAIGRLKPATVATLDGVGVTLYAMSAVEGMTVTEYTCLIHPAQLEPVWAKRQNVRGEDGVTVTYSRWAECEAPADLTGFASLPGSQPSEKQIAWWKRSAARCGLDPNDKPTRKSFVALPVLSDLKKRVG